MSVAANAASSGDSAELEDLFDSILAANRAAAEPAAPAAEAVRAHLPEHAPGECPAENVISQLGHLTRRLHDTLRELGHDGLVEKAAQAIPDARQRLAYVATLTEQAATRTLSAIEASKPLQDELGNDATRMGQSWDQAFAGELSPQQFRQLADDTRTYLRRVTQTTQVTGGHLMEIMMAQDFQDLTGQVIKKITDIAQDLEAQMVKLLVDNMPGERRDAAEARGLAGPVINGAGRTDVVTSQSQVDELLESLGF